VRLLLGHLKVRYQDCLRLSERVRRREFLPHRRLKNLRCLLRDCLVLVIVLEDVL
jgi:hypothetical protein